jgi:hypothetical protein
MPLFAPWGPPISRTRQPTLVRNLSWPSSTAKSLSSAEAPAVSVRRPPNSFNPKARRWSLPAPASARRKAPRRRCPADKLILDVGKPDIIRPSVGAHLDRVAAFVVGAVDQDPVDVGFPHVSEGDFLLANCLGHSPSFRRSRTKGSRYGWGLRRSVVLCREALSGPMARVTCITAARAGYASRYAHAQPPPVKVTAIRISSRRQRRESRLGARSVGTCERSGNRRTTTRSRATRSLGPGYECLHRDL